MWFWKRKRGKREDGPAVGRADRESGQDIDLVESLQSTASAGGLGPENLFLSILFEPGGDSVKKDRNIVLVGDGRTVIDWQVDSLRALFRGDRQPPPDSEMAHYPALYVPFFYRIEYNVYRYCRTIDLNPVDAEFVDLYSQMRRRPDGRSLGPLHDVIWQSAALILGRNPWSEAEYTAVLGQLARSARHFKVGPASRNYIEYIRREVGDGE
jgi:hypothetical protein